MDQIIEDADQLSHQLAASRQREEQLRQARDILLESVYPTHNQAAHNQYAHNQYAHNQYAPDGRALLGHSYNSRRGGSGGGGGSGGVSATDSAGTSRVTYATTGGEGGGSSVIPRVSPRTQFNTTEPEDL